MRTVPFLLDHIRFHGNDRAEQRYSFYDNRNSNSIDDIFNLDRLFQGVGDQKPVDIA